MESVAQYGEVVGIFCLSSACYKLQGIIFYSDFVSSDNCGRLILFLLLINYFSIFVILMVFYFNCRYLVLQRTREK